MINPTQSALSPAIEAISDQLQSAQLTSPLTPPLTPMTRRSVMAGVAAFAVTPAGVPALSGLVPRHVPPRILVGSGAPEGILSFLWDANTGTLTPDGIAAVIAHSTWLELSPDRQFLYVACELEEFQGKPTGSVASFNMDAGKLKAVSAVSSTGKGTCHLTTDHTGHVVIAANYTGGSAASFLSDHGKLSEAVWTEQYKGYPTHGPHADRQEAAHAHFASVSPDNRFAYINDLGSDKIHIYQLDAATGKLTAAGAFDAKPGNGPRTLHFHPNGKIAYSVNELASTVDVLQWNAANGSLTLIQTVELLPAGATGATRGCDTVLTRDGLFAYFANRDHDFLISFHVDPATGKLTIFANNPRTSCGGKIPRNFRLDPTERWMLVANQDSNNISIFARDPKTGILANQGKSFPAATPMCIVFV